MRFDESTAERVRDVLRRRSGVTERRMFGGMAFLLDGKMCVGVLKKDLVLRLGMHAAAAALAKPHVRPMNFTGKPMKSMVYVDPAGFRTDRALRAWIQQAVRFVRAMEEKSVGRGAR